MDAELGGRGVGGRGREESYIGSKHVCMGLHGGLHIRILKNHLISEILPAG